MSTTTASAPNGETVQALAARVAGWLGERLTDAGAVGSTTVVVAHAGSIRAAICLLANISLREMFDIQVEHARATVVNLCDGIATVTNVNTTVIR